MKTHAKIFSVLALLALPLTALAQENDWKVLARYDKTPVKAQLADRLMEYAAVDTQAQISKKVPSSAGQLKLAKALAKELKKNGAANVKVDKFGIVTAEVASNLNKPTPTVLFLAHLDTAPEFSAANVKPKKHTYKGSDIVISAQKGLVLNTYNAPQLLRAKGHDIITASGDTLLGADGKAGLAILLTAVQYLYDHPQIPHGTIKLAFTPDSATGAGVRKLNVGTLGADTAYALDAAEQGTIVDETFITKSFTAVFEGERNEDLGRAINTPFADNVLMASDFHTLLPRQKRPETTANKNGFIFVDNISTQGNRSEVTGLLRAFSAQEMDTLTQDVTRAFETVKGMNYKGKNFSLTFTAQDKNMGVTISPISLQLAEQAMQAEEVNPQRTAARSATDGARLAEMGLAAPSLFTGYYQAPGELEYADVDVMESALRTVLRLATLWAEQPAPAK